MPLPAVCSVEGAGIRLRRATLGRMLSAGGVPLLADDADPLSADSGQDRSVPAAGRVHAGSTVPFRPRTRVVPPPDGDDPRVRMLALTGALVAHDPPTVVEPADAHEAADVLLAFLARHGYLRRTGRAPVRKAGGEPSR